MSMTELERPVAAKQQLRVIDCDINPAMTSWSEVHPYLDKKWIDHLLVYGSHLRHAFSEALTHPRMSPDAARVDAYPEEGGPPGSSLALMRQQHIDPNGVALFGEFIGSEAVALMRPDVAALGSKLVEELQEEVIDLRDRSGSSGHAVG